MNDLKKIYVLGPNAELNEKFIGKYFSEEYQQNPELFILSTEKLEIEDEVIFAYIIYNNDEEWLYHYTNNNKKVVLVDKFNEN